MRVGSATTHLRMAGVLALLVTLGARCDVLQPWAAVAYGDSITSITAGHPDIKWCGIMQGIGSCESRGIAGERTGPGIARLMADLAAGRIQQRFVVLAWGANDVGRGGFKPAMMLRPIENAVNALLLTDHVPVLWQVTPRWLPLYDLPKEPDLRLNAIIEAVNSEVEALADSYGLPLIQGYDVLHGHPELFRDHVHPSFHPELGQLRISLMAEWELSLWKLVGAR